MLTLQPQSAGVFLGFPAQLSVTQPAPSRSPTNGSGTGRIFRGYQRFVCGVEHAAGNVGLYQVMVSNSAGRDSQ